MKRLCNCIQEMFVCDVFDYYHWDDTSAGGLLVPEGIIHTSAGGLLVPEGIIHTSAGGLLVPECIIRPVISALALTWFIRFIFYLNLQFLKHLFIIKTKVLSSLSGIGDFSIFWLSRLDP